MSAALGEAMERLDRHALLLRVAFVGVLCVGLGLYSVSLGIDTNWDLKNYHIYDGFAFVKSRLFYDVAPAQLQTYFNPLYNILYFGTVRVLFNHPYAFVFLQGLLAVPFVYFAFRICFIVTFAMLGRDPIARLCACLAGVFGVTGAGFVPLIGTSFNDVAVGGLALASLALVLNTLHQGLTSNKRIICAGVLTGVALAIKLTALIFGVPLLLIVLITLGLKRGIVCGFSLGVAFLLLWTPHAWTLWVETGNPLFPFYNDIFKSPEWKPVGLVGWHYKPKSLIEAIFFPFYWVTPQTRVTELHLQELRPSFLYASLGLSLLVAVGRLVRKRDLNLSSGAIAATGAYLRRSVPAALMIYILTCYLLWFQLFSLYRYSIALEALTGAGIVIALASIFRRQPLIVASFIAVALVIANIFVVRPDWGHTRINKYIIEVERLPVAPGSLVLIADRQAENAPHAYLVPFLPRDVRVLGISNNIIAPGQPIGLNRRIEQIIAPHPGPFATISAPTTTDEVLQGILAHYDLTAYDCSLVRSNLEPGGHKICQARRK